jgi:hypothetical protein
MLSILGHPSTARWPSGLRRQLKVNPNTLVRKGVGSNPTLVTILFASLYHYLEGGGEGGGGMGRKNRDLVILDVGFVWTVDPFFLCAWVMKPVCDGLAFCASF